MQGIIPFSSRLPRAASGLLGQTLADVEEDGSETVYVVAAIRLLILTGCRLGEIQKLKWEFIKGDTMALPDSKTGARRIPLPQAAREVLSALPRLSGNPYVIVGIVEGQHATDMQRPWRRIRELAGLSDVRIHDLRHSYASSAISAGTDLALLMRLLGHTQIQTTMRYAHLYDAPVRNAAEENAKGYNESLEGLSTQTIERRKKKLLKDRSLVAGLGFKMKERPGASETFAAPKVRRKIRPATPKPTASREPFKPEPILTNDDYEHILSVLENMVGVMEQSPGAFRDIDEESLRTHFLVQLNGHYSGDATGETFNYEGKTDILIKADGRNIFIAECKFWTGEKGYLETLDQVLSYLSWRDTKAAVLVFSRNKDFTGVLDRIEESTPKHPSFKKMVKKRSESSWTYLCGHKDDANREISITVQAYNVPERIEPRIRTIGG